MAARTNPESFVTIRKTHTGWDVVLVTPAGPKLLRTALSRAANRKTAVAEAKKVGTRIQRPVKTWCDDD